MEKESSNTEFSEPAPVAAIATPANFFLLGLFILMAYIRLRPKPAVTLPRQQAPIVFKTFTPRTLRPYDGTKNQSVYLAIRGNVFDVTPGKTFYGPRGPYANFAGRDASRGLACGSFDEEMLTKDLDGPLDSLDDLDEEQKESLKEWEEKFEGKYLKVGRLVPQTSAEAKYAGDEGIDGDK
ncbi:MAG: hypothetical protein M1817_003032 [Caeruleum heppii]|nr:MAG: hypothetical protein M1817_003032 [Caeruleum heppii]